MDNIDHKKYMTIALQQAQNAMENNEVPTGCVIIRLAEDTSASNHHIIARAHNQVETLKDPTAHAEMIAITQATNTIGDWRLTNTILYVTKEPCVMCAGAIILARIPTVVFGAPDKHRGGAISVFNILNHDQLNHRCKTIQGIMKDECKDILQQFFKACRSRNKIATTGSRKD